MNEYKQFVEAWKSLHAGLWQRYANSAANEKLLLEGAQYFRPCLTAVDRSFHNNKASFVRTDGHDAAWDAEQDAQRTAAQNVELEASTIVDDAFVSYIQSLSQSQIAEVYYRDLTSEFSRKYRICVRELGYRLPAAPVRVGV